MFPLAETPQWVQDWGVVLGGLSALCAVVASVFAAVHYSTKKFKGEVAEVIMERVPPMIHAQTQPIIQKLRDQDRVIAQINQAVNNVPKGDLPLVGKVDQLLVNQRVHMIDDGIVTEPD